MNFLQVKASKLKKTYLNLSTLTKVDLLENGNIELTWPRYFDVLVKGDPGYQEVIELLKLVSKGVKSEGDS
ncbi:unnamed protein product [marine sediment metagenome]|uniref:Uncharacterized protein n=1 Tax=marine sediment metagenome TaxID=412755 RepID=X1Q5K0_9ZZZZ